MEDDTAAQGLEAIWVSWTDHVLSFHQVDGYERLDFRSSEEKLDYVFQKTSNGFRIQ